MVDADVAVVGAGTVGSLAAGILAERGLRVLCFERFDVGHGRGGAGGGTRMFRIDHGPQAPPVEWILDAQEQWRRLEAVTSRRILLLRGGLWLGQRDGAFIQTQLAGAHQHGLPCQVLAPAEVERRFPPHRLAGDEVAVLDPGAGFIHTQAAVVSAVAYATQCGATVLEQSPVSHLEAVADGVRLRVGDRCWTAARVLVAAGAWVRRLIAGVSAELTVKRLVVAWAVADDPAAYRPDRFPVFIRSTPDADLTGWPAIDGRSVKVSQFAAVADHVDPDQPPGPHHDVQAGLGAAVARFVPGLAGQLRTLFLPEAFTTTGRPIVGQVPGMAGVYVVAGLSGRGFKLAPVLARSAADAITADGHCRVPRPADAVSPAQPAATGTAWRYAW